MSEWRDRWLSLVEKARELASSEPESPRLTEVLEEIKAIYVRAVVGGELRRAKRWLSIFRRLEDEVSSVLGVKGVMKPKEFKSFVRDPELHLRKKLFIYVHDLARGRLSVEEFESKASAALKTSLMTNQRSLYQSWVYLALVAILGRRGYRLVYPDDAYIHLERSGRQKSGLIPPNSVLSDGFHAVSLFIEAPRPLGWEDSRDLSRIWSLYVALRPDMLAYGGRVLNIVRLEDPSSPILRPDVIIECKELEDWYDRIREVKGPLVKPLTAEEWRHRWLQGLWDGLADVLGVSREEAEERVKERRGVRLRDRQIVVLYKRFYEPKHMILVSRARVPSEVRRELREEGIEVMDGVGFRIGRLEGVADMLEDVAKESESRVDFVELSDEAKALLLKLRAELLSRGLAVSPQKVVEEALRLALSRADELASRIGK